MKTLGWRSLSRAISRSRDANWSAAAPDLHHVLQMSFAKSDAPLERNRSVHAPVQSLVGSAFDKACANLMHAVACDCRPDLLVGVRTGGLIVAEAMAQSISDAPPVLPLTSRRSGTSAKSRVKFLPLVLRRLPQPMVDRMRVLEHRLITSRRRGRGPVQHIDHGEAARIGQHLAGHQHPTVLVVDDAVDSGVTLATVLQLLRDVCPPKTEFRSAVITVTLDQPLADPDYALHRGVLCRFPWSFDAAR